MAGRFRGNLPERTFELAKVVLDLVDELPSNCKRWVIAKQLARCGTSVGANIAEADEAQTDAEFTHRCSIARKEASETRYWLRLCKAKALIHPAALDEALKEVDEIVRILVSIVRKMQEPAQAACGAIS